MSVFDHSPTSAHPAAECDGCSLARAASRRDFLRDAAATAGGLLLLLGARPVEAARAPLRFVAALSAGADEVRYPLPAQDGVEIDTAHDVILVRHQQAVYAFARACPHQHVAVRWQEAEGRFQCPKHKSRYQRDGTFISGRATRHMDRLPLAVEGAEIIVNTDAPIRFDRDPSAWAAAVIRL
jgi:nitrite reductase/ring-hydroxylating ferredoxin subunit